MHVPARLVMAIAAIAGLAVTSAPCAAAFRGLRQDPPDLTRDGSIPAGATHDWNLGPTGLRGWMHSRGMETSEARQIAVTQVDAGSPADGRFAPGDVILGIGQVPFDSDPRVALGRAIGAAEAADGQLTLIRWRGGATESVTIPLAPLGAYGPTAPFDCPKSQRVFERGCEALARNLQAQPDRGNVIVRCLNALALLSSGRAEYLPRVRDQVQRVATYSDPDRRDLHSWYYGPINLLLAEYTLATGDRTFEPDLRRMTMEIVHGQSGVGSWGHRFVQSDGRLAGYGMMNAPGLPLTVSLILAREAGVADSELDAAIERSVRLLRFYVGKGSIPYGDHEPWIQTHDDNGKNGVAAVMFQLLRDAEAAEYFSRMSVASHGAERDSGHTGNFFNMLWALPGVTLSGPHACGAWMSEFGWYYDLARRWDGTFIHQGPPSETPDKYHRWDCSGAYLLGYAQPLRRLYITGKTPSVCPQVDAATAARLIADGRGWSPQQRLAAYAARSDDEIWAGLRSWSPVVRERSALELARRPAAPTARLIAQLREPDLHARLGACQAVISLQSRAAAAVPELRQTLSDDDLWLRIKAAQALSSIGEAARVAIPELLAMLASPTPPSDPRAMQQRYLCFALFDSRRGLLNRSLDGVDRDALNAAVRAGLGNEDGRARGAFDSVYKQLSADELEPLFPAIYQAIVEPAPSGIMFADGIRLSGLEVLARHRIEEGIPLCLELIEPQRWGLDHRIRRCLAALSLYGGNARGEIRRLQQLEQELQERGWKPDALAALALPDLIRKIEADRDPPPLRPLEAPREPPVEKRPPTSTTPQF